MKNIIPWIALTIGMIGSPVLADETQISEIQSKAKISKIMMNTWERVQSSIVWNDLRLDHEWRKNAIHLVKGILPGNPVSYYMNWIQGIVYPIMQSDENGIKLYAWAYRSTSEWTSSDTKYGILLSIPIWWK